MPASKQEIGQVLMMMAADFQQPLDNSLVKTVTRG
jgi:hypothetical protein